ncbi:MAG: thermopsin family protease [Thermoprotei archaeon]
MGDHTLRKTLGKKQASILRSLMLFALLLFVLSLLSAITLAYNHTASRHTADIQPSNLQAAVPENGTPMGIVDYGDTRPFNTTGVMGNSVVYSLGIASQGANKSAFIQLVGVLRVGSQQYYQVQESLMLNQEYNNTYSYLFLDSLINLSSNPSKISPTYINGGGQPRATPNYTVYSHMSSVRGVVATPFEFTPSITVSSKDNTVQIEFYAALKELSPPRNIFSTQLDSVTISESSPVNSAFIVGGTNPLNHNLLELVLNSVSSQPVRLNNVDGYFQLFYKLSDVFTPVLEASSVGGNLVGGVLGVKVYPIYNETRPLALISSTTTINFATLWPLNDTTISLILEKQATLGVNGTRVNLSRGLYQLPQYGSHVFIDNIIQLTSINGTKQSVTLSAPFIIQPQSDCRGVFLGWNKSIVTHTLKLNITSGTSVSVLYQPQYLIWAKYMGEGNSTQIGESYEWANASSHITVNIPTEIYEGAHVRFVLDYVMMGAQRLNTTSLTVTAPITLNAYYTKQFLVSFIGQYQKYYSTQNVWVNSSSTVNITLPQFVVDGVYSRLAYQSYTLNNHTNTGRTIVLQVTSPINITLNYTQQYQVNFTGSYSQYFYNLSNWYNQGQNYNVDIPRIIQVNTTFRLLYNGAIIGQNVTKSNLLTGVVDTPVIIQLKLTPQFYVNIRAPNVDIQGFYNGSSVISVQAPYYSGNLLRLDVFQSWVGTVNASNTQLTVVVSRPISEVALYHDTYIRLVLILTMLVMVTVGVITLRIKSKVYRSS